MIGFFSVILTFAISVSAPTVWALEVQAEAKPRPILPVSTPGFRDRPEASGYQQLCDRLFITNRDSLDFKEMERRLLCDDQAGGEIGQPWSQIPPNEAAYFLRGFLQTRGYHHPNFYQDRARLYVDTGPITRMKTLSLRGGPEYWLPPKRRLIEGEPLTPALLNEMQGWALGQIKDEGYACAEATIQADPETGEAVVFFTSGERKRIRNLEQAGDGGLREGALDRYNAFVMNDYYRERMIGLTRRRTLEDGFLQTLVMNTRCDEGDAVSIVRDVSLGAPRTVRIGFGGTTDKGGRVVTVLRQSRIGTSASSAEAKLDASYLGENVNYQKLTAAYRWYYLHGENRYSLNPTVSITHDEQNAYEIQAEEFAVLHGWTFDTSRGRYDLKAGPDLLFEEKSRGPDQHKIQLGFLSMDARWTDHDFEWFNTSPRTGSYIDLTAYLAMKKLGSPFTAQKFQIAGEKLWPLGHFDPPLFILATRFNVSSVFAQDDDADLSDLPIRFRTFLGGENDLRGFGAQTLPRSQVGALSGANASVEGRLHRVIYKIIDVFGFLDAGLLGRSQLRLDAPVFMSPGLGLRYESPFGVLRTYVARRFAVNEQPDQEPYDRAFRLGVTFGEEF